MSVNVFIQDHSGDYNFDLNVNDKNDAVVLLSLIQRSSGYWFDGEYVLQGVSSIDNGIGRCWGDFKEWACTPGTIFVPWHRIDCMKLTEVE